MAEKGISCTWKYIVQEGYFVYSGLHYEGDFEWGALASLDNM
jgi:hypothetical protein